MKKPVTASLLSLLFFVSAWAADPAWQPGRIVEVTHRTDTKSKIWVVNTPLTQEEEVYTITVHVRDRILSGSYVGGATHVPPPGGWQKDRPVEVQIVGDYLYVRSSPSDQVRARISKNKSARFVQPWTPEEAAAIKEAFAPLPKESSPSMIGFQAPANPVPQSEPPPDLETVEPQPAPAEPTTGLVAISSVPYLAEVFVDGQSMGYTPAKLRLAPGKHTFRCEKAGYKAWTKDIEVTAGSELTLDATLALNKK
jgi:hypothetical protein